MDAIFSPHCERMPPNYIFPTPDIDALFSSIRSPDATYPKGSCNNHAPQCFRKFRKKSKLAHVAAQIGLGQASGSK